MCCPFSAAACLVPSYKFLEMLLFNWSLELTDTINLNLGCTCYTKKINFNILQYRIWVCQELFSLTSNFYTQGFSFFFFGELSLEVWSSLPRHSLYKMTQREGTEQKILSTEMNLTSENLLCKFWWQILSEHFPAISWLFCTAFNIGGEMKEEITAVDNIW